VHTHTALEATTAVAAVKDDENDDDDNNNDDGDDDDARSMHVSSVANNPICGSTLPMFPASSPYVTTVGATQLMSLSSGR
jgi:hypothetical protein